MRVPLSWLRDFAPFSSDAGDLATALSGLGLVVEGVERVGEGLDDVVVARVMAIRPHPNADKLQLVDVDTGDVADLQVVCGAFNFSAGDVVPLAPAGARLPGGMEIGRRKVRGQWSNGMLCSGTELRLSSEAAGILLLDRGLVEVGQGRYGSRAFFTEAGLAELRALLQDRRAMDPERFAHLRRELGLDAGEGQRTEARARVAC